MGMQKWIIFPNGSFFYQRNILQNQNIYVILSAS